MKNPHSIFAMTALAVAMLVPASAMAQSSDTASQGYLADSRGVVVMSGTGLCWRHRDPDMPPIVGPCNMVVAAAAPVPPPAPVVVAAAPPAVIAPMAVAKPLSEKISFSGDALFAFDKSELKPEGKALLDGLVHQLEGAATYDTIMAIGHTDRFGRDKYNQSLSERRAATVKNYLVSKDVKAGRIDAEGMGESQPVTKLDDCKGPKSAKVVACLQPDRRVDIEMTGTRTVTTSR